MLINSITKDYLFTKRTYTVGEIGKKRVIVDSIRFKNIPQSTLTNVFNEYGELEKQLIKTFDYKGKLQNKYKINVNV